MQSLTLVTIILFQRTQESSGDEEYNYGLFILLVLLFCIGAYAIFKLYTHRVQIQRLVLQKKVEKRTSEISKQKEELQRQSEELKKAYEEIKTKNIAIEEAFEHLSNSFAKLSDLNREKDGIVRIVAHDLRTPLNNIEGLIQLVILDGNLNDDQKDYISKIRTVVKRGNEMIRDLLDINLDKSQKPELNINEFNLGNFIENWKVNFEEQLSSKKQKLILSGDFSNYDLKTDEGLLLRILDNLMSNAIKFSKKGTKIQIDITEIDTMLQIAIQDEGPGISESDQQKMFKPFTRLSATPTDGEPSNGLGLSIIKSLSERMGGTIAVDSELEKGTTFIITIPLDAKNIPVKKSKYVIPKD